MTKRLSAIVAAATLGLSAAAFAQTSTPPAQAPSAAPGAPSATGAPTDRTGSAGRSTTQPGTTTAGKPLSEADVRQELEKQGYTRVSDVKKKGDRFEAKGMKDGKQVSVNVDAKTGKVVAR
jgi:hypothetical protein